MFVPEFANYNLDYQRKLGFLKLLVWAGNGVRGGKDQILGRLQQVYPPRGARRPVGGKQAFDARLLLERPENPSWVPAFSPNRLDRLVLWGEMTGLLSSTGRLSEWSRVLLAISKAEDDEPWSTRNPFVLSVEERAFFLHLLLYHDHVLAELLHVLSKREPGGRLVVQEGCLDVIRALGSFYDRIQGTGIQISKVRQESRGVLEKIARDYKLPEKTSLLRADSRAEALQKMGPLTPTQKHVAEQQAVCRLEQLADLGFLAKENPRQPPTTDDERRKARTSRVWYIPERLKLVEPVLDRVSGDVERLLTHHWVELCDSVWSLNLRKLRVPCDQEEVGRLMDSALPLARRQLGAIQVHTWTFFAALAALGEGLRLEIGTVFGMLDAMRRVPVYGEYIRHGGQETYLGRTASVVGTSMEAVLMRDPLEEGSRDGER